VAELNIVRMAERHLDALAALERICFSEPWTRAGLAAELNRAEAVFAVAELGGRTAGYAGMHCVLDECYVDNVAVFPQHRRAGIARALMRHLIGRARARRASFLTLEVRVSNAGAIALYRTLGFREAGRRRGFYRRPAEDALILTLFLSGGPVSALKTKTGPPEADKPETNQGEPVMKILGIESSCDETAAAVVENGRTVLSSVVASQVDEHKLYGGVVPEIASRRHCEAIVGVVQKALDDAGTGLDGIDAVAVTYAPGLIGALLVGVNFAKGLSLSAGKPLVPVHHLRSHIAANYIAFPELEPPFLCLVVSGGHTHIVEVLGYTELRVLGRTRDDAAGEAFDKAARAMGIPYPGGVELDKIAESGNAKAYRLPRPSVDGSPYDFSFSGLKTNVINQIHNARQRGETLHVPDLAASYRQAVVDCLTRNFFAAARDTGAKKLAIAGGVSANALLRRTLESECAKRGLEFYRPQLRYCGDNAAMVGAQGYYEFLAGHTAGPDLNARAEMPIESN
jgi:N6-L-threonylcarbamoyladenine synthase